MYRLVRGHVSFKRGIRGQSLVTLMAHETQLHVSQDPR